MAIRCVQCTKQLFSMSDVTDVSPLGFALYGNCKHCGARMPVSGLWAKKRIFILPLDFKKPVIL
jgi:hypothetical protein